MPKYRYSVINPENKQLTGSIEAEDEKSAREELNQLGFSVISIKITEEDATEKTVEKPIPKFEFSALDKNMKKIVGTIQAEDRYSAYKRLIKEYLFEVDYLIDDSLDENHKKTERIKGVYELQNKLDQENIATQQNKEDGLDLKEFTEKQEFLQKQVNFVLTKVKEMLDLYEAEIKPETKEKIRRHVDKILRIKNSTNLDYIRKSCEELLSFLQKEELFLHEEKRTREHAKLSLEAKNMISQLHKKKSQNYDIVNSLRNWRKTYITENEQPNILQKFTNFLISLIIGFGEENAEIQKIREQRNTINQQLKEYIILYIQAPSADFKFEAKEAIKKLWKERKNIRKELRNAKIKNKTSSELQPGQTSLHNLGSEILSFSGWLLVFYLLYYFISIYIATKNFGTIRIPKILPIYNSIFLKYFLTILFLFHCALSIKIHFFKKSRSITLIIASLFIFSTLIILLNF